MGKHILCLHLEISDKASQHLTDSNWLPSVNQSLWPGEDALIGQSEYMIDRLATLSQLLCPEDWNMLVMLWSRV